MKILVASPYLPWPLDAGGKVAVYSSLACLCGDHQFTLLCPVYTDQGLADAAALQKQRPEIKVRAIYCGAPRRSAPRDSDILVRSLRWGARQYRRLKSPPPQPRIEPAVEAPAYPFGPLPAKFVDALADELKQGPDLLQAEFAEMMPLAASLPAGPPRLFVHHQIHFVYAQRFAAARKWSAYSEYLQRLMLLQEEAYLRAFDGVIVFSEEDKRALLPWLSQDKVHISPFAIAGGSKSVDDRFENRFSFVGSEEHFPNRDALEWLISEVWPKILAQMPNAVLNVIGPWGEESKSRFSKPGVAFTGFVDDLESVTKGSIMLVPLRIGSGIRVKLLDALSQGVPAVSTSIGCEGIPATDGLDMLIRDGAAEFAGAAIRLANSPDLRMQLAGAGRDLVTRFYSPERVRIRRNEIYHNLCNVESRCASSVK